MNQQQAADFLHERMKPVYGYCLRRCASPHDAEDLAQEILLQRSWRRRRFTACTTSPAACPISSGRSSYCTTSTA